jgi:hypothetical protein
MVLDSCYPNQAGSGYLIVSVRFWFGGWRLAAGGWRLAAGGWRLAAGGWRLKRLETGNWKLETGNWKLEPQTDYDTPSLSIFR